MSNQETSTALFFGCLDLSCINLMVPKCQILFNFYFEDDLSDQGEPSFGLALVLPFVGDLR